GAIEGARDSLVYRYDERGNLVEQVRSIRLDQQTLLDRVTYRYDAANQLLEIGYPSGLAIGYPRNAGGQVASVTLAVGDKAPSTLVGQIAYLPFGPLLRLTWGNGITLSREYDQDYQLLRQKVGPWQSDYQHDANGNIQQHRHSLWGTLDYQYDPLDRLTEERGVQGGRSYAYDAVGNRTQRSDNPASGGTASSQDYQYAPDSNRLTAIGAQAVTSDAAGNLTQDRPARKLAYDAQGRLQSVSLDGQQVAEYRYNALGQRIVKLTPESVTTYLYGPDGQLLGEAEHDGSGRKLRAQYYLWLDSLPLATIDADYDAQGKVGNPTLLYLHGDHLDTPRLATDASGQIAWQWQSDAFGRGEALSQGSTQVNLRFPGQYYDAESGLHYNYFRDYDPETGRYVESDPIGLVGGLNTYGYVEGNPLGLSDPLGLAPGDLFATEAAARADALAYQESVNSSIDRWLWGNMVYGFRVFKTSDCLWTYEVQTPVLGIAPPLGPKGPWKVNKPGVSGKAGAKDVPSWAKGDRPYQGESGKDFAKRIMDQKYGKGNWKDGPGSEYNQIKKWGDRSFIDPK
ncbi:TPA: RHS repeat protein, partial [Pseudomonas aeruginosa]|nr:RHS repeat protein [Pseudomonas aeruginosa]